MEALQNPTHPSNRSQLLQISRQERGLQFHFNVEFEWTFIHKNWPSPPYTLAKVDEKLYQIYNYQFFNPFPSNILSALQFSVMAQNG